MTLGLLSSMLCPLLCARAAIAKDTMGLESEQVCPAARVLQDIMSNEQAENDPYLYLDPHPRVSALRLHQFPTPVFCCSVRCPELTRAGTLRLFACRREREEAALCGSTSLSRMLSFLRSEVAIMWSMSRSSGWYDSPHLNCARAYCAAPVLPPTGALSVVVVVLIHCVCVGFRAPVADA